MSKKEVTKLKKKSVIAFIGMAICVFSTSQLSISKQENEAPDFKVLGEEAFQAILQFYQYDKDVPLEPIVIETTETDGFTLEKIAFKGANELLVPGYFAVPKNTTPPYPCVIHLHGMTLSKEQWWHNDGYHRGPALSPKLLGEGFAVLSIDYAYHGERSILNNFESTYGMLFRQRRIYKFRDMVIDGVIDSRRALDYLESREEIDSARLGVIGSSIGGTMSLLLAGVDSRIKVTTALVAPALMKPIYDGQPDISSIAPYNFVRAFNRRPLLMLMGRKDSFNYSVAEAQALFDLVQGNSKELIFFDSGHRLPEEYADNVLDWFVSHLK